MPVYSIKKQQNNNNLEREKWQNNKTADKTGNRDKKENPLAATWAGPGAKPKG